MDMCDMITHRRVQSEKIQAWVYKDVFLHEQFKKIDDREWDLLEYIGKKLNMPVVQKTDDLIIKASYWNIFFQILAILTLRSTCQF